MYIHKNNVAVFSLTMVADAIGVSKCGSDSVELNAFMNAKTNCKKLKYGEKQCVKMHIGSDDTICPDIYIDTWKVETVKNYKTNNNG